MTLEEHGTTFPLSSRADDEFFADLITMKRPCVQILIVFLAIANPYSSQADDVPLEPERFLEEYVEALRILEERFARINGTCKLKEPVEHRGEIESIVEVRFAVDHGREKVEMTSRVDTTPNAAVMQRVYCFGESSGFQLIREPGSTTFAVRSIGLEAQGIYTERFGRYLAAPYCLYGSKLSRIITSPTFRLSGLERVTVDGRNLVRFAFESGDTPQPNKTWLLLDPALGWCIRAGELSFGFTNYRNVVGFEVEYETETDGTPRPRLVRFRDPPNKISVCEFTDVSWKPTSPSEFKMTHYDLPDLEATASRSSGMTRPLLGIGTAGLALGGLAWWLGKRRRRQAE